MQVIVLHVVNKVFLNVLVKEKNKKEHVLILLFLVVWFVENLMIVENIHVKKYVIVVLVESVLENYQDFVIVVLRELKNLVGKL